MPEGTATKNEVLNDFLARQEKMYEDEAETVQRMATFHHNFRFVNAENRKVRHSNNETYSKHFWTSLNDHTSFRISTGAFVSSPGEPVC